MGEMCLALKTDPIPTTMSLLTIPLSISSRLGIVEIPLPLTSMGRWKLNKNQPSLCQQFACHVVTWIWCNLAPTAPLVYKPYRETITQTTRYMIWGLYLSDLKSCILRAHKGGTSGMESYGERAQNSLASQHRQELDYIANTSLARTQTARDCRHEHTTPLQQMGVARRAEHPTQVRGSTWHQV